MLFVILISSLSAMLLQSMTVRLGIATGMDLAQMLSLIHISEPTRHAQISYAVFCLKKET
ncbi:hypothetical protein JMUB7531_29170 [Staphylococcus aureus]